MYENVAGMDAAVAYLEDLGRRSGDGGSRTAVIHQAMDAIAEYERTLSASLLDAIAGISGARIHGVTDRRRLAERVPTLCFTVSGVDASAIAERMATRDVGIRSGHMYSPRLMARLGLMPGGVVRASLVHYNTLAEVARFRDALEAVVGELT